MTKETKAAEAATPDNLGMWNRLQTTPTTATKSFKGKGGFSGTAINGMYIIKRLTEEFGPCGIGWRFVVEDDRTQEGHSLKNGDRAKLHIIRGHLEYRKDSDMATLEGGWFATSPQFGQTMLVDENKYGVFTDEEAAKKSVTDCLGKCASTLGIGADIFLGMYDDSKYVNQRKQDEKVDAPQPDQNYKAPDPVAPTEDDMAVARQVFSLVKSVCANAKDRAEIDDCLRNNKAALGTLENASPSNFASLKVLVEEARKKLDDPLDDELPPFA